MSKETLITLVIISLIQNWVLFFAILFLLKKKDNQAPLFTKAIATIFKSKAYVPHKDENRVFWDKGDLDIPEYE